MLLRAKACRQDPRRRRRRLTFSREEEPDLYARRPAYAARALGGGTTAPGAVASAAISWRDARFVLSAVGSHLREGRDDIDLLLARA